MREAVSPGTKRALSRELAAGCLTARCRRAILAWPLSVQYNSRTRFVTLRPGTRLGSYEILSALGAGGMGEVYQGRDTRLDRTVAIKILPEAFAHDADRLARFQREARTLAALNHPHIAQIYGLEEEHVWQGQAGTTPAFLVMELVAGEDLSQRIARGTIPLDEALPVARQIAEALEAAHDQGIVHRDLKPANVKLRPDGTVKVLDFGLAKAIEKSGESDGSGTSGELTNSPTITSPMTHAGMILGTAAYMAPEQAKGRAVDRRADIWAFGCVLYEMLTGVRPFKGDDMSDTFVSILRDEPDWSRLPAQTPDYVRALLRRCLQKDPRKRLPHIGVARLEIAEEPSEAPMSSVTPPASRTRAALVGPLVGAILGGLLVGVIAWTVRSSPRHTETGSALRFQIEPPPREGFNGANGVPRFAVSPDGTRVVFSSTLPGTRDQLWIRRLDTLEAQPLQGTDTPARAGNAAQQPFWSPDGRTVAYFDESSHRLKKVDIDGGPVQTLCELPGNQYGGTWNQSGTILASSTDTKGIQQVSATGGQPTQVTTLDPARHEAMHLLPQFLPDGKHFLYLSVGTEGTAVYAGAIDAPDRRRLVESPGMARYAPGNLLLYVRGEALVAQGFDPARLELSGSPTVVADSIGMTTAGRVGMSVSDSGILVYSPGRGSSDAFQIVWTDRAGKQLESSPQLAAAQPSVELSPNGKYLAFESNRGSPGTDVWIYDLERDVQSKLTTDPGDDQVPIWSPDSERIVFRSNRGEAHAQGLYEKAISGVASERRIFTAEPGQIVAPMTWTPDGKAIVFAKSGLGISTQELWILPLDGEPKPVPYLVGGSARMQARLSPNGHWLAYTSDESGVFEVFVQSFPDASRGRWQISSNGGRFPRWRADGRELYYVGRTNRVTAVSVTTDTRFEVGKVQASWEGPLVTANGARFSGTAFDVTTDGQRFVTALPAASLNPGRLTVVANWAASLTKHP
jgi:eukaryotic-like serine/threonine-protein kinase